MVLHLLTLIQPDKVILVLDLLVLLQKTLVVVVVAVVQAVLDP